MGRALARERRALPTLVATRSIRVERRQHPGSQRWPQAALEVGAGRHLTCSVVVPIAGEAKVPPNAQVEAQGDACRQQDLLDVASPKEMGGTGREAILEKRFGVTGEVTEDRRKGPCDRWGGQKPPVEHGATQIEELVFKGLGLLYTDDVNDTHWLHHRASGLTT
eukprot:868216-Prymnesium_polylepis.1